MSEILTLAQLDITIPVRPVFIRKINNKNRWIQYSEDIKDREQKIAEDVFSQEKCSLWRIESDDDFYGFVASISSNRSPQNQNIDFIWITENDLEKAGIKYTQVSEGDCLAVRHLHYDAVITQPQAIILCQELLNRNQPPLRCRKKKETQIILEYQAQKGCIAVTKTSSCQYNLCN